MATKIGAEFTIIVALEIEVMSILKCHKVKSTVNANAANAAYIIVLLFFTLNKNFLLSL